eukprot:9011895-Alexandrium_andersonii.AAC.1
MLGSCSLWCDRLGSVRFGSAHATGNIGVRIAGSRRPALHRARPLTLSDKPGAERRCGGGEQ